MAEHIARQRFQAQATSAGVQPGSLADTANAVYTLKQSGIDASAHEPRDVREMNLSEFDLIVCMDNDVAREIMRLFPELPQHCLIKWKINDPYGDDLGEYDRCAKVIYRELKKLLVRASKGLQI